MTTAPRPASRLLAPVAGGAPTLDTIHNVDCMTLLRALPDCSVNCVVTSPPYFGLRDYGVAGQIGLEPTPQQFVATMVAVFREVRRVLRDDGTCWINLGDSYASSNSPQVMQSNKNGVVPNPQRPHAGDIPSKNLMGIPWRVAFALQDDGWILRSDITWCKSNPMPESVRDRPTKATEMIFMLTKSPRYFYDGDAIRERVGEARIVKTSNLQNESLVFGKNFGFEETPTQRTNIPVSSFDHDGSFLKRCISFASSVLDLAKTQDQFSLSLFDAQIGHKGTGNGTSTRTIGVPIIRRASAQAARFSDGDISAKEFLREIDGLCITLPDGDDLKELWAHSGLSSTALIPFIDTDSNASVTINNASEIGQFKFFHNQECTAPDTHSSTRNKWNWWVVPTEPTPFAHFATFPRKLIEPMILAGCPGQVCSVCGAPWERVIEMTRVIESNSKRYSGVSMRNDAESASPRALRETIAWQSTCQHDAPTRPGIVLDPFMGSGTTALVARHNGRHYIGCDINADYVKLARERLRLPFEPHHVAPNNDLTALPLFASVGVT